MSDLLQKFRLKELRDFYKLTHCFCTALHFIHTFSWAHPLPTARCFTSDTKEFHFHKRDFDWLIRNFEYSWKRMFTSDLTHGWWRARNVSESTVGYRRWSPSGIDNIKLSIIQRKFKQWWSTIPPISINGTLTSHLHSPNTKTDNEI